MIYWFLILIVTALYSTLFWYLSGSLALLPVWIICGFLLALIMLIVFVLLFILFAPYTKPNDKIKHRIIHSLIVFFHSFMRIKITIIGKENLDVSETHVVYGNHKSMLDITILYQVYNEVITAVAKDTLLKVPLLRRLMKSAAVVAINRENDREGVKNMLVAIGNVKKGFNYIIFPEGGIKTRDVETMVALRAGAYKLASKPQATICPVSIIGSSQLAKRCPKHRCHVYVVVHKPIPYEEYKEYQTNELGLRVGTIINNGILTKTPNTKPLSEIEIENFVLEEHHED